MSDLNFVSQTEQRNVIGDWTVRIGVACVFVVIGLDKFQSTGEWIDLFNKIGIGDWFRWFTGAVEVLGGLLVLIPKTAVIGFGLLGVTMLGAALILAFRVGEPGSSIFPLFFLGALTGAALWTNRNR